MATQQKKKKKTKKQPQRDEEDEKPLAKEHKTKKGMSLLHLLQLVHQQ